MMQKFDKKFLNDKVELEERDIDQDADENIF